MPTLSHPISPVAGPVLELWVGVTEIRAESLRRAGLPVPPPVKAVALIDTGASDVLIDTGIVQQLALTPTGASHMHTPSTAGAACPVYLYDVALHVVDSPTNQIVSSALQAVGHPLGQQHIGVLLGRTFLRSCRLTYDGPGGAFRLEY